ncbi:TMEM175 family protein [uncultured Olegusella sp.]|uniref:TMEM175 family protein n=1 Tax=uncultured Olegusella sp. TaxID=1979846 RepID=UPI002621E10A|nr:TMEM175 family protein [uncultured Olegusella sp.]
MTTDRLEAFSDGCIAIFITITLLTFQLPEGDTYANLLVQAPAFFCYAISFIVTGIYWGNHHHLIHTIEQVSEKIMWANMAWLFALSLVSFATGWVALYMLAPHTVSFFGVILLACNRTYVYLEHCVVECEREEAKQRGARYSLDDRLGERIKERIAMCLYASGAVIAFWLPWVAVLFYFVVNVIWFVPDRRIVHIME